MPRDAERERILYCGSLPKSPSGDPPLPPHVPYSRPIPPLVPTFPSQIPFPYSLPKLPSPYPFPNSLPLTPSRNPPLPPHIPPLTPRIPFRYTLLIFLVFLQVPFHMTSHIPPPLAQPRLSQLPWLPW